LTTDVNAITSLLAHLMKKLIVIILEIVFNVLQSTDYLSL